MKLGKCFVACYVNTQKIMEMIQKG